MGSIGQAQETQKASESIANMGNATQVRELEAIKSDVNDVIEQLAAISQENAASTEETSAYLQLLIDDISDCKSETKDLTDLSTSLKAETDKFSL